MHHETVACPIPPMFSPGTGSASLLTISARHTMEKYDNGKLRSTQFPYHLTNTPKAGFGKTPSLKKLEKPRHLDTPTTYMVINFDEQFVESVKSEMPPIMKVDEKKTKQILAKLKKNSPDKPDKLPPKAPKLVNSYILPKVVDPDAEAERIMFRRHDVGTQTELNMNKIVFTGGLSGYQTWTSEVVEPFLKVSGRRAQYIWCWR